MNQKPPVSGAGPLNKLVFAQRMVIWSINCLGNVDYEW